ncbi:hypothetical protein BDW22DRAFT_1352153 [Trametopsis cervina]|nr:hypothetical protein BDW22DRAFT_1352153 [Trametopsis cervina]
MLLNSLTKQIASTSKNATASSSTARYSSTMSGLRNWGVTGLSPVSLVSKPALKPLVLAEEPPAPKPHTPIKPTPGQYRAHREKMKAEFPDGWSPPRKVSRQAMDGIRLMHAQDPEIFTTPILAEKFKISPEAVRRILKSKWEPTREKKLKLLQREERQRQERVQERRLQEMKAQLKLEEKRRRERERQDDRLSLT